MPDLTTRYGLKKPVPDGSETADLRVWVGENMDLLDVALGHVEDKADAAGQAAATAQQTANAAQQAASAAQAAAETAQETADTALSAAQAAQQAASSANTAITSHVNASSGAHPASAISNTPAGNISATTVQAAINELDSEKAGKGTANTFTAKQTFAAGAQLGDANADLIDVFGLIVPLNTHTRQVTAWDSAFPEKPKMIQIKDGSTVLATIDVTSRNSEGRVTQLKITQGARTRTWNITWTAGKEWPDSITVS